MERRDPPILTGEDARRFLEREKEVDAKRKQFALKKQLEFNNINSDKYYKVISLSITSQIEPSFNLEYHNQYLNNSGKEVKHYHQSKLFKDFKCIQFDERNIDWFHKDDLLELNLATNN